MAGFFSISPPRFRLRPVNGDVAESAEGLLGAASHAEGKGMNRHQLSGAALVLVAGVLLWEARSHGIGGFAVPGSGYAAPVLASAIGAMGLLVIFFGSEVAAFTQRAGLVVILGILTAFAFVASAMDVLGYNASIAIAVVFLFGAIEGRHPVVVLGAAALLAFGSHYLFETALHVPLPRGFMSF
jgi:hypothetical protein